VASPPPLISVVIPAFNREAFLGEAIDSAIVQTYPNIEIIVVDDGSTDRTPEVAAGYGDRVVLLRQANAGASAARNTGIGRARGELIALLDSDDRWLPDKLALQAPLFADSRVGLAHGAIRCFRSANGNALCEYFPGERLDVHDLLGHRGLCTQTLVFRRRIMEEVGGFDPSFKTAEDWEWTIRVAARYQTRGLAQVVAENRIHESQLSGDKDQLFRDARRVIKKHAGLHSATPGGCEACRAAVRRARQEIRSLHYGDLNLRARRAASVGRFGAATALALRAIWKEPAALLRLSARRATLD